MSSALAKYESFLVENVSTISTLESTLRSITWILPGRLKDGELASESLSAGLNVMSMYHDTLLARYLQGVPKYKPLLPSSPHAKYTRAWCEKSAVYKWAARVLELICFTQLLIEMGLRRKASPRTRWRGIVLLEVIKAGLRLLLLRITRRPLLSPPIPEREFDPSSLPAASDTSSPTLAPSSPPTSLPSTPEHLKNNHVPLPVHPLFTLPPPAQSVESVEDYLLTKALTTADVKSPTALVKPLTTPKDWISEGIYTLRPLAYAVLLSSTRGEDSDRAIMGALALEVLSRNLRRTPLSASALERSEYAKRDRDMLWYLLRGSIWRSWTRPKLEAFANTTARVPLLNVFGALMQDWIPLIDEYYYYTAP